MRPRAFLFLLALMLAAATAAFAQQPGPGSVVQGHTVSSGGGSKLKVTPFLGANGVWFKDQVYPSDFEAGATAATSLSPHISLVGSGFYGFGQSCLRASGGVRVTASDVNDPNFSVGVGLQYYVSSKESLRPQEMAVDASVGYRPWPAEQPRLILIAQGIYGLTKGDAQALAGVRFRLGG